MRRGMSHTFKQGDEVSFNSFLQGSDSRRLESQISLKVLSDFTDKTLESTQKRKLDPLYDSCCGDGGAGEHTEACE
jgi:hypothetical protein